MNKLNYILFSALLVLVGCTDTSVVDPENTVEDIKYKLNKNSNAEMIKVFPAMKSVTIDGLENEWARAPKHKMRLEVDAAVPSPIENKDDLTSYFKMLWDEEYLYVFASIQDEEINVNGDQLFERDGFEIYIDGDNSKNVDPGPPAAFPPPAYDSNDDFFRFIPGEAGALSAWGIIDASNFQFAFNITEKGYDLEVKIPFADLPDFPAEAGHVFGVEFQTNDNDNYERQNFLKWNSELDDSYFNPSLFGTAVLF